MSCFSNQAHADWNLKLFLIHLQSGCKHLCMEGNYRNESDTNETVLMCTVGGGWLWITPPPKKNPSLHCKVVMWTCPQIDILSLPNCWSLPKFNQAVVHGCMHFKRHREIAAQKWKPCERKNAPSSNSVSPNPTHRIFSIQVPRVWFDRDMRSVWEQYIHHLWFHGRRKAEYKCTRSVVLWRGVVCCVVLCCGVLVRVLDQDLRNEGSNPQSVIRWHWVRNCFST